MCLKRNRKAHWFMMPVLLIGLMAAGCNSNDRVPGPEYPETLTDIDGNVYDVVVIGDQAWMAENLRVNSYRNGDPVTGGLDDDAWLAANMGAYAVYPHDEVDGLDAQQEVMEAYGVLYNWYAVNDPRGLCPPGWHVPTDEELTALTDYIREHVQQDNVANVLKSCRQVNSPLGGACDTGQHPRWDENEAHHGTDDLGFNALPAGNRSPHHGGFETIGHWWTIWSSTEHDAGQAVQRWVRSNSGSVFDLDPADKTAGKSVRCIWSGE